MPRRKNCDNCGDEYVGAGNLCKDCLPAPAKKKGAAATSTLPPGIGACPHCKQPVTWNNVGRMRRAFEDKTVEVIYFCGSCRAWLEAAAWSED